jgi:hypothetical protein
VELLCELLLPRDDPHGRARDSGAGKPVSALHPVHRLQDNVADPDIHVESSEDPGIHLRLDWKTRTTVWCVVQIHNRRRNRELEPIAERNTGSSL